MKRYAIAAALLAVFGTSAAAQPVPSVPLPPPVLPAAPPPPPVRYLPPIIPPGPAIPFIKSGGIVVGADGYYPYDTGLYLLGNGGADRYGGYFTMAFPGSLAGDFSVGPTNGHPWFRNGHFRRR
ncbi:MAG: hypothetical protein L0241_22655 [Planctomycetia bacterium]|nr:hypothetical protein [Planctomycetia bacterium]